MALTSRHIFLALLALTLLALGATAYMTVSMHHMEAIHYAPAVILVLVTIAWPFANGWRPSAAQWQTCPACGTHWHPKQESSATCPVCAAA